MSATLFFLRWLAWEAATLMLFCAAYRCCRADLPSAGILGFALMTLIEIALGAAGRFEFMAVAIGVAAVSIILIVRTPPISRSPSVESTGLLVLFLIASTLAHLGARTVLALMEPPSNWDSNWYHLPTAVDWLRGSSLWVRSEPPYWFHPRGAELALAWLLMPSRSDVAANLFNFFILAWMLVAVWSVAKNVGLSTRWRWFVVLTLANLGVVSSVMLGTQKNDLMIAALFVSALAVIQNRQAGAPMFVGLACGLLVGVKLNGLAYAGILIVALALNGERRPWHWTVGALSAIAMCGFWFVRNWVLTGRPLLVVDPSAAPDQSSQALGSSVLGSADSIDVLRATGIDLVREGGWMAALGVVVALVLAVKSSRVRSLALVTLACVLVFLVTPYTNLVTSGHSIVRLGFPFVALAVICFFCGVEWATRSWSWGALVAAQVVLGLVVLVPSAIPAEFVQRFFVSPRGVAGVALFMLCLGAAWVPRRLIVIGSAVAMLAAPAGLWLLQQYRGRHWNEAQAKLWAVDGKRTGIFGWVEGSKDERIAVYGAQIFYPFYGPRWQNTLFFDNRVERSSWVKRLAEASVSVVVFCKLRSGWPEQRDWVQGGEWQVVYQDELAEAWRLKAS